MNILVVIYQGIITYAHNEREQVEAFLIMGKAFYRVWHNGLLYKLTLIQMVASFLASNVVYVLSSISTKHVDCGTSSRANTLERKQGLTELHAGYHDRRAQIREECHS